MAKNWRNSGFVAKFLTKYALLDEQKICGWKFLTKFALFDARKMAFLATTLEPSYLGVIDSTGCIGFCASHWQVRFAAVYDSESTKSIFGYFLGQISHIW